MDSVKDRPESGHKIAFAGAATSVAVIGINFVLGKLLNIDFLSYAVWFVVPVGALAGGAVAASGYYLAAKWTHTMPSEHLRRDMVIIGGTTWLSYLYFSYFILRLEDGTLVREYLPFWEYFKLQAEHTQLTFRDRGGGITGTSGELGMLGYAREGLQALGFLAGGLVTYQALEEEEACIECRKYTTSETVLAAATPAEFDDVMLAAGLELPGIADDAEARLGGRALSSISLKGSRCPNCDSRWLRPIAVGSDGKQAVELPLRQYRVPAALYAELKDLAVVHNQGDKRKGKGKLRTPW